MRTAADTMRISLLGPLEVSDAAGKPVRVGGYRVRALLILLALDPGRFVPAYALIDRLWPDEPQDEPRSERNAGRRPERPADAANALQSLVSRLRTALRAAGLPDGVVESSAVGYRLAVPPDAVDAVAFERGARAGSQALARGDAETAAETLRAALGQWRGGPLTDVAGEEFAFAPAARLAELRTAAVLDRVEADLALGAADAATIGELRELIAADQLAERPAALLMYALAAAGRQSEALAVYRHTRDRLADHLGVDPSPRLERAYLAVLRQEVKEPPKPRPKPEPRGTEAASRRSPTSFVGRADDLAALLGRLRTERLVTLTGPGGVGKTRLATEAAARLAAPAWLAELAPVSDPAKVTSAVLDAQPSLSCQAVLPALAGLVRPVSPMSRRTWCASRTTSCPPTAAAPPSGRSRVARMRTAVVLLTPVRITCDLNCGNRQTSRPVVIASVLGGVKRAEARTLGLSLRRLVFQVGLVNDMRSRSAERQFLPLLRAGGAGVTIWSNMARSGPRSRWSEAARLAWSLTSPWSGRQSSCHPAARAMRFQSTRCTRPLPSRNGWM